MPTFGITYDRSDNLAASGSEILRGLIDEIRLVPVDGAIGLYLVGNLAAILNLCANKRPGAIAAGAQVTLVAGARTHLYRTVLIWFHTPSFPLKRGSASDEIFRGSPSKSDPHTL